MKQKESILLALVLWLAIIAALLFPTVMTLLHAVVRLFTEGNATAKSMVFLAFLAVGLTARQFFAKREISKNMRNALLCAVVLSMAWGLFLQLFFFQSLNLNVNSFPSYVTSCGSSWCWEGTYIQHNHVT
ncbi:MAG: hypothetical protein WC408_05600, partial [Candidatus Micrarchaeia archaeon]